MAALGGLVAKGDLEGSQEEGGEKAETVVAEAPAVED